MIDRLYLDLAEEKNDLRIYGKLLQACQAAADEFSFYYEDFQCLKDNTLSNSNS